MWISQFVTRLPNVTYLDPPRSTMSPTTKEQPKNGNATHHEAASTLRPSLWKLMADWDLMPISFLLPWPTPQKNETYFELTHLAIGFAHGPSTFHVCSSELVRGPFVNLLASIRELMKLVPMPEAFSLARLQVREVAGQHR